MPKKVNLDDEKQANYRFMAHFRKSITQLPLPGTYISVLTVRPKIEPGEKVIKELKIVHDFYHKPPTEPHYMFKGDVPVWVPRIESRTI